MRSILWPIAALIVLPVCGDEEPVAAPFGLDTRPSNLTCVAKQRPVLDTGVTLQRQWENLTFNGPLYLTQAPGDNDHWYVVEQGGKVRVFPSGGGRIDDFATAPVVAGGEAGLLGMAFHPGWPSRRDVYLSYTRGRMAGDPAAQCASTTNTVFTSVVARYRSSNGSSLDIGPEEILEVGQPYENHNGGNIQFGRDGMLYLGLGDGGSGNDPCRSGQNLTSLLGKILRIDISAGTGNYTIPDDNPFFNHATARKEIWAYGLRNPWRWSFDRATGDLWLGDVGQGTWEEVDRIQKGGNYGWNTCEGIHKLGSTSAMCATGGLTDAIVEHGRGEASSITGGYVYRGTAIPGLIGAYIYGDFGSGNIWALTYDADNKPVPRLLATVATGTLASFGQGNDGEIYTVQINTTFASGPGILSRLVPSRPQPPSDFPQLLSQTGCVDPGDPSRPADGVIPYDVNAPLWSDGADKQRWFAIPDGTTITIGPEQDWDLPIGSVAMKTFSVGGRRVETRLFMRHDDGGWAGYTYEWNDDGKDATLLPANKVKALGAATSWAYPSRNQCLQCHSRAAGGTIGLETAQMNRDGVYPLTNRRSNQLATLDHIGMFSTPLAQPPADMARLADPAGKDSAEARARAYLHSNCSHCHRPSGGGQGTMDLRYSQAFADTHTCNAMNTQGGVDDATQLIVPGAPERSVLSKRLHATDAKRMPPVAVSVTDDLGTRVIDDWIRALSGCP